MSLDGIKVIQGESNIILVAPHGRREKPLDDIRTADIALKIQEKLKCYAVVNEKYRKAKEDDQKYDLDKEICDLNRINTYEATPLYAAFIDPIKRFKDEIKERGGTPYIFHIHGAGDAALQEACEREGFENATGVGILLGTGKGNPGGESLTATSEKTRALIENLKEEQIIAHSTSDRKYAARKAHNLNQLFKKRYNDESVVSFQLEIRHGGYRDSSDNATNTATRLASAIENMLELVLVVEGDVIDPNVPAIESASQDEIDQAVYNIIDIYQKAANDAMLGVGQYLIETFFNGDFESARKPRNINSNQSIRQIYEKLGEHVGVRPSKTWVYDALKVCVDNHFQLQGGDFQTYGNLSISHKVKLAYVNDPQRKQELIEKCSEDKWTVRKLVSEIKAPPLSETPAQKLSKVISKPELLIKNYTAEKFQQILEGEKDQAEIIKTKVAGQLYKMEKEIKRLKDMMEQYQGIIKPNGSSS